MPGLDAPHAPGSTQELHGVSSDARKPAPPSDVVSPRTRAIHYHRQVLHMRRQRDKRFGQAFTIDRGWDLLLLLMIARLEERTTNAGDIFGEDSAHGISIEELDRQIRFGNVILMDAGDDLELSQVVLSDEAARHLIDLFRIDTAPA